MKKITRLTKLVMLAALAVYLIAPGVVSPTANAEDRCFPGFVCDGGGGEACDCPISNCTGCFIHNGEIGCGNCAGDAGGHGPIQ